MDPSFKSGVPISGPTVFNRLSSSLRLGNLGDNALGEKLISALKTLAWPIRIVQVYFHGTRSS